MPHLGQLDFKDATNEHIAVYSDNQSDRDILAEALMYHGDDPDYVRLAIIEYNLDVDGIDALSGTKYISIAASHSCPEVLAFMFEKGARPITGEPKNLFHYALIKKENLVYLANPDKKYYLGFGDDLTDLDAASVRGDWESIVKSLDDASITVPVMHALFYWVAIAGHIEIIEKIVFHQAFVDLPIETKNELFNEAMHGAKARAETHIDEQEFMIAAEAFEHAIVYAANATKNLFGKEVERLKIKLFEVYNRAFNQFFTRNELRELIPLQIKMIQCYEAGRNQKASSRARLYGELVISIYFSMLLLLPPPPPMIGDDQKEMKDFEVEMIRAANEWGYSYVMTKADGSCFFHAVAHQLISQGLQQDAIGLAQLLRDVAVRRIEKKYNYYKHFTGIDDVRVCVNKYLKPSHWADDDLIQALVNALDLILVIIRNDGAEPIVYRTETARTRICIGYEIDWHYTSLVKDNDLITVRDLWAYVDSKPYISDRSEKPVSIATITEVLSEESSVSTPFLSEQFGEPVPAVTITEFAEEKQNDGRVGKRRRSVDDLTQLTLVKRFFPADVSDEQKHAACSPVPLVRRHTI